MDKGYVFLPGLTADLAKVPENSVLSQVIFKDDKLDVTLFNFAAGQELTEHTSPHAATIEVLQGEGSMTLGRDAVELKPGSWIYMAPELPHSLKTRTQFVMLLTLVK